MTTAADIASLTATEYGITLDQLKSYRIGGQFLEARNMTAYLAWEHTACNTRHIAEAIGRSKSNIMASVERGRRLALQDPEMHRKLAGKLSVGAPIRRTA